MFIAYLWLASPIKQYCHSSPHDLFLLIKRKKKLYTNTLRFKVVYHNAIVFIQEDTEDVVNLLTYWSNSADNVHKVCQENPHTVQQINS